ncbi:MAG: phosphonate ABC transporter ATP-binding protein [Bacillota bacterium]|uniref:Phosphonate ABC transporter ATP-binding protein n=1 Tax=Thermanaerosceptrum fracticalcis TaxID=1712410 RepID=A0A7G6DYS2_THEFR|nr:phosphonate ABC transporter ATP-binding protein [Thermanaerosceptrum fracticalcis]QNB44976.1 phosphonate ABC transporter ATP-binding protein [Thermanaerosceptrum fracticalcis]
MLLEVKNVTKSYGGPKKALDDISFVVKKGEFVAVIGPSGAGKSTLLRCINRMVEASSGEVIFSGASVYELSGRELRRLRSQIGMIFQHYNLVNRLTVIENVLHGRLGYKSTLAGALGLFTEQEKRQALEILQALGLEEQLYQRCDQLSGGQKQRVGIARALLQNPKMLLCDEPIASLDPSAAKIIMDHLKKISQERGITCLVNLHQVDVALAYSDRIIGIKEGRIVYDGPPGELTAEKIYYIYGSEAGELIMDVGGSSGLYVG